MSYYHFEDISDERAEVLERYAVLTPIEVMDILHIGKNSVYELLNSGQLVGFRVGRSWRITADALEDFMLAPPTGRNR